ncbi:MAG: cysteine desulfurase family protein [Candidatus Bipolaricaulota bacterium]
MSTNNKEEVYLDHGATTPVAKSVLEKMLPFFNQEFGNPSSPYTLGQRAKHEGLERSRESIAGYLDVDSQEIIFTSGATEANNLAIKGLMLNHSSGHFITTNIEHHAVLHPGRWLQKNGYAVTHLKADSKGLIDPDDLRSAIRKDTKLVSIMYANNEIGTVQPIGELSDICRERGIPFHTDAVQAFGKFPLEIDNVDMLSASAHKIYGPKGVGFLYRDKSLDLEPLFNGGGHEGGVRSGTENVPGAVGMAAAVELLEEEGEGEIERQKQLRDKIIRQVEEIPNARLNGHRSKRIPNNVNTSFASIEGESLVMKLDNRGIATSTGSACSSPDLQASHVLLAIGLPAAKAHGSLRITLGRGNTAEQIDYFLDVLPQVVEELREASPFYSE